MKDCRIRFSAIRHVQSFLIVLVISIACLGQTGWEWLNRLPRNNDLYSVPYGNGMYLAGKGTVVNTSPNGLSWTTGSNRFGMYGIASVNYLNGKFFLVGPQAIENYFFTIVSSVDGVSWTADTGGVRNNLSDVSFGNGRYAAVGRGGESVYLPEL